MLGRLASGLNSFHTYYRDKILDNLALLNESRFGVGPLDMDSIYEYGELIWIIDDVFMETIIDTWFDNLNEFVAKKQKVLIVVLSLISFFQVVIYFIAKICVINPLKEKF